MKSTVRIQELNKQLMAIQKEHRLLQRKYGKLESQYQAILSTYRKNNELHKEIKRLRELKWAVFKLMLSIMQENVSFSTIKDHLELELDPEDLQKLYKSAFNEPRHVRKKALAIIFHLYGINIRMISEFLFLSPKAIKRYIRRFKEEGVSKIVKRGYKAHKKAEDPEYREKVLSIIHSPPSEYGINRTTWTINLIKDVLAEQGYAAGKNTIPKIIRNAGYRFRKAKEVLTSNDPQYREKVSNITRILSTLGPDSRFFSIDECGPLAVKKRVGRKFVRHNQYPTVPKWQRSKGSIILTAALELSTNQITHFYSTKKDTEEMIILLEILIQKYSGCRKIYLSGDAASWHSSKAFMKKVEAVNEYGFRKVHNSPAVELALLPAGAQFLNVIESVFSGMVRAVIDNSDYQSVYEAKTAIDLYFEERNEYFRKHPKKAGNKIWRDELVLARFKEGQNCKARRWR